MTRRLAGDALDTLGLSLLLLSVVLWWVCRPEPSSPVGVSLVSMGIAGAVAVLSGLYVAKIAPMLGDD